MGQPQKQMIIHYRTIDGAMLRWQQSRKTVRDSIGGVTSNPAATWARTDSEERERLSLKVDEKVGASIAELDENRHLRLILFSGPDGPAGLGIMGAGGEQLLRIGTNPDGSAEVAVLDKKEKVLFHAP
jgi:hypothetical protein